MSQMQAFSKLLPQMLDRSSEELHKLQTYKQKITQLISKLKASRNQAHLLRLENQQLRQKIHLCQQSEERAQGVLGELRRDRERERQMQRERENDRNLEKEKLKGQIQQILGANRILVENKSMESVNFQTKTFQKDQEITLLKQTIKSLKLQLQQRNGQQKLQIEQLTELIERQNKALKQQNQECQSLAQENERLGMEVNQFHELVSRTEISKKQTQQYIEMMNKKVQQLMGKVDKQSLDWKVLMLVEQIRLGMREQVRDEVDRIENIIGRF